MTSHLKVHYFQHIAGEGFGSCYTYLKQQGAVISATEFFALPIDQALEIEALPSVEDVDLLIIMGGTMSVNDEVNFPWLKIEKRWLRRYLAAGKPAIGLCLGGQLIANALDFSDSDSSVSIAGWQSSGMIWICITDHGRGIPQKAGEPGKAFQQIDRATNEQQGMGLGLFVSRRIIEEHGGILNLSSVEGKGTQVNIGLPLCSQGTDS